MALIVRGLSKAFGNQPALKDVNLSLPAGVIAVLGPNGAGKSTLLRLLATLIRPDAGEIVFEGHPYRTHLRAVRTTLGYLPADLGLPDDMTPRELLRHLAVLKMLHGEANISALLQSLALGPIADTPLGDLSGGEVRLVGVAQTFLGTPRLIVLDEPTRGLDVRERARVFRLLSQPIPRRTVVFSTQLPDAAALIASQVVVLRQGSVLYEGDPAGLMAAARQGTPSNGTASTRPRSLEEAYLRLVNAAKSGAGS